MERDNDIVELGSVSAETLGNFGPPVEVGGRTLHRMVLGAAVGLISVSSKSPRGGGHERLAAIDLD